MHSGIVSVSVLLGSFSFTSASFGIQPATVDPSMIINNDISFKILDCFVKFYFLKVYLQALDVGN
jgi:hypothetical protein